MVYLDRMSFDFKTAVKKVLSERKELLDQMNGASESSIEVLEITMVEKTLDAFDSMPTRIKGYALTTYGITNAQNFLAFIVGIEYMREENV